jgi:hypothetical protein
MHSGFFRLKRSFNIAEQKKLHMKGVLWQPSSQKIPKGPWQNGHKVCYRRMGLNHDIFFIPKSYREFCCDHFGLFAD